MTFDPNKSWIGFGSKIGGMLVGAGVEYTDGIIVRSTNTDLPFRISIASARIGLGLGFSGGIVVIMVFNCNNINALHNTTNDDWGVTIAAGARLAPIVRSLRNTDTFARMAMLGWRARGVFSNGEQLRNILHESYTLWEIGRANQANKLVVFETPIGTGAELAVNISSGLVRIG